MRNNTADIIRGFAMLLVVLGHTISGTVQDYSNSLLFQAIWTLQMPLFIIISGYVTRYSRPLTKKRDLWKFIKKRTLAYLLPWIVWSIVVRGIIFGQSEFLNIKHMLWHMDSGYWFLITIWTISIIFGIAELLSNKLFNDKRSNILSHLLLAGIGLIGLATIGYSLGIGFFAIKLTLYYLPIYMIGYLFGQIQDWFMAKNKASTIVNGVTIVSLGLWLAIINRFDFYSEADEISMIIGRFGTSMLGCTAIIGLFTEIRTNWKGARLLNWTGIHSLEIYLTHYLFLKLAPAMGFPIIGSMEGLCSLLVNFALTIVLTITTIQIVQGNKQMNYLLYAKH